MSKIPFKNINIGVNVSEQRQRDYDNNDYEDYEGSDDYNYDEDESNEYKSFFHHTGEPITAEEALKEIKESKRKENIGKVYTIIIFIVSFLIFSKIFETILK